MLYGLYILQTTTGCFDGDLIEGVFYRRLLRCPYLGSYFFFLMSQLAEAATEAGGGWTGIITVYAFFAWLLTIGISICFRFVILNTHQDGLL